MRILFDYKTSKSNPCQNYLLTVPFICMLPNVPIIDQFKKKKKDGSENQKIEILRGKPKR